MKQSESQSRTPRSSSSSQNSHSETSSATQIHQFQNDKPPSNQFSINQDANNQILTFYLQPNQTMHIKGEIVASNRPLYKENHAPVDNLDQIFLGYRKLNKIPPTKIINSSIDIAYYCIRRKGGGGKILYLNQSAYAQKFIFDYNKLLTINYSTQDYTLKHQTKLPYLSKIVLNQGKNNQLLSITLQSNPGSIIMQKSLGLKERIYIGNSRVLAISQSVTIGRLNRQIYLQGPGYVFLQGKQQSGQMNKTMKYAILMQFIMVMVFPLLFGLFLDELQIEA